MVRSPMQVDDNFRKKMKQLQEDIMRKKGKFESMPKITGEIIKTAEWKEIEKRILGDISGMEIKIKFDKRRKE